VRVRLEAADSYAPLEGFARPEFAAVADQVRALREAGSMDHEAMLISEGHCPVCLLRLQPPEPGDRADGWCQLCLYGYSTSRRWLNGPITMGWWYDVSVYRDDGTVCGRSGWVTPAVPA
jgi:hypothetical protein